ncbi:hypothetical protein RE628_19570 [Paenibacillus sp. D2_2]|uniref:hypothetical protein n=1 Tax=Paenibacillus sp. D2_2 TaxID=3073092 RepID=UPI002814DD92|nr:hypothetical protein [Paenibacillus sp. D2_2]WMT39586.1 hypothetical protein RE628_19570 [Paenibacillus sp. D2_2]
MKKFSIPWTNSTYLRFLLLFISVLLPIYVIGLLIYNWGIDAVEEQVYQSVDSQMTYHLERLSSDVDQMRALMLDSLNDDNLNYLATISPVMTTYERQRAITRLQQRLNAVKSSNELISDVVAYLPQKNMKVSGVSGYDQLEAEELDELESKVRFTSSPERMGINCS